MAAAVSATVKRRPVKVVPLAFQVCARSSTGADAVSVPLLAVSVVNVPAAGVVLPIGVFWIEPKVALLPAPKPRSAAVIGAG